MEKYVYAFNEGNKDMRQILGGKGANLAEMTKLGLPVPSGFTVTTKACDLYYQNNQSLTESIIDQINIALAELETMSGKKLGNINSPLLLSVRSGAANSMPGMMDTVLNVGLTDEVVAHLASISSNPRFVYDSYRRFISMYADVVKHVDKNIFEHALGEYKTTNNITEDQNLTVDDLQNIIKIFKELYVKHVGKPFSNDPKQHLLNVIISVFESWNNDRAIEYRNINNISNDVKTAVNVQEMVYGNFNEQSATGVVFSRNPSTGEDILYGEFLFNAQGEDIVAGVRTPIPIAKLETFMPELYQELYGYAKLLENHYLDMQDMEFTIENGKLYMLQTRNGKRSGLANIVIALDLVKEKLIDKETAINRISVDDINQASHASFDSDALKNAELLFSGLSTSPGVATGQIYFSSHDIEQSSSEHKILVRLETSADDIIGMKLADAIVTGRGGMTSHAAVVARGMGKVSVTGCEQIIINENNKTIILPNGTELKEGDFISVDGTNGVIYQGALPINSSGSHAVLEDLLTLINQFDTMPVMANAETVTDVEHAINNGASGIGLCRTEHMFFEETRLNLLKQLILVNNNTIKQEVLTKLKQLHEEDFINLIKITKNLPLTIRYLDPPLHEFIKIAPEDMENVANELNITVKELANRITSLQEFNPMMGNRGARLLLVNQDITIMQTEAIAGAIKKCADLNPNIEIMIPLITNYNEAITLKKIISNVFTKADLNIKIGIMIETPRAAIIAHHLAPHFDFFSFGTNDLTQLTYGISRDDSNKFMPYYLKNKIFNSDPFITIDEIGVGTLLKTTIINARSVNSKIKLGICGEHAGDPNSIKFLSSLNLNYLSASPYRILNVKLLLAQNQNPKE